MIAADRPVQRRREREAAGGRCARRDHAHAARRASSTFLRPGDLVVANDAATLPASLRGVARAERRADRGAAGRPALARAGRCARVHRRRVRRRRLPHAHRGPARRRRRCMPGDRLALGPLRGDGRAHCSATRGWSSLRFDGTPDAIWAGLARARPADPVRARPRAAGAVGRVDADRRRRRSRSSRRRPASCSTGGCSRRCATRGVGVRDAHARGRHLVHRRCRTRRAACRSTSPTTSRGDRRARSRGARARGGRIVAIGTTVVRALEHAAPHAGGCGPATALATQRIGAGTPLRVVDAILSGTHEPGTSHHELLRAFADDDDAAARRRASSSARGYRTHEFGDSVLIERASSSALAKSTDSVQNHEATAAES